MGSKIRDDLEALKAQAARRAGSGLQATTFVGLTAVDTTYPEAAGAFYFVTPQRLAGEEAEGAAVEATGDPSRNVLAYNLGDSIPPLGTRVLVFSVPNRLVFFYG